MSRKDKPLYTGQFDEEIKAIQQGDLLEFKRGMAAVPGSDVSDMKLDSHGRTLLHYAAISPNTAYLNFLLDKGCSSSVKDADGVSPKDVRKKVDVLHKKYGHKFTQQGVRGDPKATTECFTNALKEIKKGDFYAAVALVNMAPPEAMNVPITEDGKTLLHHVCSEVDSPDFIKYIFDRGASFSVTDREENTPIHSAACSNAPKLSIKTMRELASVDEINAKNKYGYTPLQTAVSSNSPAMLDFVSPEVNIANLALDGQNVMHIAARKLSEKQLTEFCDKVVEVASTRERGADEYAASLLTSDSGNMFPVGYAARRRMQSTQGILENTFRAGDRLGVRTEVYHNILTQGVNASGESLLHLAAKDKKGGISKAFSNFAVGEAYYRCKDAFSARDKAGNAPIHVAATDVSSPESFSNILRSTDPSIADSVTHEGVAPIHKLVGLTSDPKGRLEKICALVASNNKLTSINMPSGLTGDVPITEAYKNGKMKVCSALMASPNIKMDAVSVDGLSVFHHAAQAGDVTALKQFLERRDRSQGKVPFQVSRECDATPAMYAVREAKDTKTAIKAIDVLVPYERDTMGLVGREAILEGRMGVLDHMLKKGHLGVDDVFTREDGQKTTLISEALNSGNFKAARHLIKKKGASVENSQLQETALTTGIRGGCFYGGKGIAHMRYLMKNGAKLEASEGSTQTPPLMAALEKLSEDTVPRDRSNIHRVVECLTYMGADVDVKNAQGSTATHIAVESNDYSLMKYLVDQGANLKVADGKGDTPLIAAARRGDTNMFRKMVKSDPDSLMHVNGINLASAFHEAIRSPMVDGDTVVKMLRTAKKYTNPDAFKAIINSQDHTGSTLIHLAAEKQEGKLCRYLLNKGVKLSVADSACRTPSERVTADSPLRKRGFLSGRSIYEMMAAREVDREYVPYVMPELELTEGRTVCVFEGPAAKGKGVVSENVLGESIIDSPSPSGESLESVLSNDGSFYHMDFDDNPDNDMDFDENPWADEFEDEEDLEYDYDTGPAQENVYEPFPARENVYETVPDQENVYETVSEQENVYETVPDQENVYETVSDQESVYSRVVDPTTREPIYENMSSLKERSTSPATVYARLRQTSNYEDMSRAGSATKVSGTDTVYTRLGQTFADSNNVIAGSSTKVGSDVAAQEGVYETPDKLVAANEEYSLDDIEEGLRHAEEEQGAKELESSMLSSSNTKGDTGVEFRSFHKLEPALPDGAYSSVARGQGLSTGSTQGQLLSDELRRVTAEKRSTGTLKPVTIPTVPDALSSGINNPSLGMAKEALAEGVNLLSGGFQGVGEEDSPSPTPLSTPERSSEKEEGKEEGPADQQQQEGEGKYSSMIQGLLNSKGGGVSR